MTQHHKTISLLFTITFLISCSAQKTTVQNADAVAFPGAEGFGKYATGGREGKVFIVSNLNDDGEGSFRQAAVAKEKRMIVFAISGTIHLLSPLKIAGNATIAGHSAPGDGICLADQPVSLGGDNIILQFLRLRMGDRFQDKGKVPGSGHDDALSAYRRKLVIIDHCSISWSTDECFSVYNGDSTTLQWNLISEPLNYSYHFEEGDKDYEHHGYGAIWGGRNLSAHHNLFAHCVSRTPRFDGIRNSPEEFVDYRNNVIYNWGGNNVYGGEGGRYNIVNNFYKAGPMTSKSTKTRIVNPNKEEKKGIPFGKFFVKGNFVVGADEVNADNRKGVHMGNGGSDSDGENTLVNEPFKTVAVPTTSTDRLLEEVLIHAGAILPARDTLDARIISDVRSGTGKAIDVQGGFPHGTNYEISRTAWPDLKSAPAPADNDKDGMPDDWERKNGLDPGDGSDHNKYGLSKKYTNIEVYLHSLLPK